MRIRFTARALSDVDAILSYIENDNPQAAQRLRRAIFATISLVATRPYIGIKNARAPELRSRLVSRYPYRVHYQVRGQEILILHIRHGAQEPWGGSP
jgi:plasmid stabilization system protein ParE